MNYWIIDMSVGGENLVGMISDFLIGPRKKVGLTLTDTCRLAFGRLLTERVLG